MEVHRQVGLGLPDSAYVACLRHELTLRGLEWRAEVPVSLCYKGLAVDSAYRADLVVLGVVLMEVKAVAALSPAHEAQALTYMRLLQLPVGPLLNFNQRLLRDGVRRLLLRPLSLDARQAPR